MPKRNLENYPVYGINLAAREVSGDFFSFYPHNDGVYFIIADVAGKGVHAGMVMAKASTLFEIMSRDKVDPDEMIYHMNNDLFLTKTGGMFVTAILGHYNTITDEISWVNGGHQPALLRDKNGKFEQVESAAPPMGVIQQKNKSLYKINRTKLNGKRFYLPKYQNQQSIDLDISNLDSGLYILRIYDNVTGSIKTLKFVKE